MARELEFRRVKVDEGDALRLVSAMVAEMRELYWDVGPAAGSGGLDLDAPDMPKAVARLDTGPRQDGARRMYLARGYAEVGNFNANPVATFFGEKHL